MPGRTRINNPKTIAMMAPPIIKVIGRRAFKAIFLSAYDGPSATPIPNPTRSPVTSPAEVTIAAECSNDEHPHNKTDCSHGDTALSRLTEVA